MNRKTGWNGVLRLLFPQRCPVCDGIVRGRDGFICAGCATKLRYVEAPWCMKCGKKLTEETEICADCRRMVHQFVRGRALYEYESAAAGIYRLKYAGRREYAQFYGREMAEYLRDFLQSVRPDGLIPIPLHKKRKRERGYNQAELLARELSRHSRIPVYTDYLKRVKATVPLKRLNPQERQNNLKKAFKIARNDVELKTVILVDDIFTTGSTIDEAAGVLRANGVEKVYFVALARGTGV